MPSFSQASLDQLNTCHPDLIRLFTEVIKTHDCHVSEGYRDRADQEADFAKGTSKAHYGQSNHNTQPSRAVDVEPYPIDWDDTDRFRAFALTVLATAQTLGIKVRWGGGLEFQKAGIVDMPHYELINA